MRSPTTAILWEICARNRYALMFAFGAMPVCGSLVGVARWYLVRSGYSPAAQGGESWPMVLAASVTVLAALLSLASVFWSFSFTSVDERGRFGGFPVRLFTLPLRTRNAAAPPVLAGMAVVVASYCVWASLLFAVMGQGQQVPWLTLGWQLLVLATAFVCLQAIVWLLHPFRFMRMVVIALAGVGFLWLFLLAPAVHFYQRPGTWFLGGAAGLGAALAGAVGAVHWERRGGWQNIGRVAMPFRLGRRTPFRSAMRAQFWFECKRKELFGAGVIGLAMTAALMVWMVPTLLLEAEYGMSVPRSLEYSLFGILPFTTLLITAAMGGAFGKSDPWGPEITMGSFHATRPLATSQLVFAKWFAAARMVLLAWGIFGVATAAVSFIHPHIRNWLLELFWPQWIAAHPFLVQWLTNPWILLTILGLHWHTVVTSMSVVLSGQRRRVAISGWIGVLSLALFVGIIMWFVQRPSHFEWFRPALPLIAAAFLLFKLTCAFSVFRLMRREQITTRQITCILGIWIALVICVGFSAAAALLANVLPRELVWFLAVWFLPSGEMPACVIHLALNRHR